MKILFYNSQNAGAINWYNISEVVSSYPHAEFMFLTVKEESGGSSLKNRILKSLKRYYYEFNHGRNILKKHNQLLYQKIDSITKKKNFENYPLKYVNKVNDLESELAIKNFDPDIIIQCGAGILSHHIYSKSKIATINVHHGLAPEIRGMHSTLWCLYYGLTDKIGVTCHMIDETLDTGKILSRYIYPYNNYDSYTDIQFKLVCEGAKLLVNSIALLNSDQKYHSEETESIYFSSFSFLKYNELIRSKFLPVAAPIGLKTKIKKRHLPI